MTERRAFIGSTILGGLAFLLGVWGPLALFPFVGKWALIVWGILLMRGAWAVWSDVEKWAYARGVEAAMDKTLDASATIGGYLGPNGKPLVVVENDRVLPKDLDERAKFLRRAIKDNA